MAPYARRAEGTMYCWKAVLVDRSRDRAGNYHRAVLTLITRRAPPTRRFFLSLLTIAEIPECNRSQRRVQALEGTSYRYAAARCVERIYRPRAEVADEIDKPLITHRVAHKGPSLASSQSVSIWLG